MGRLQQIYYHSAALFYGIWFHLKGIYRAIFTSNTTNKGGSMPYKVVKRSGSKPYKIVKKTTGQVVGSSTSRAKAEASIRARHAGERGR